MKIGIRKRSFFELVFPLTIVFFVCIGTKFVHAVGAVNLRWFFILLLFSYLFLNRKILSYLNSEWKTLILSYLVWCILTSLWSSLLFLSFSKSILFAFNIIVLLSAGSLWVIKYGFERSSQWLFLILIVAIVSGLLGGSSADSFDSYGKFSLYSGLNGNANDFGFLMAIVSPVIFLRLYQNKRKKFEFTVWFLFLLLDVHYLIQSYSRSSMVIFLCIFSCFILSLSFSKKVLISLLSLFSIFVFLLMIPMSYWKGVVLNHIVKSNGTSENLTEKAVFQSRYSVWKQSLARAEKGGLIGAGFGVNINNHAFSGDALSGQISSKYKGEKGNSQLAIIEETGIIGFGLYLILIISLFGSAIPRYLQLKGVDRVVMGTMLGAIIGLLLESLVEGWWDSAAGPEVICFWTFVGVIHGMIFLQKRKSHHTTV